MTQVTKDGDLIDLYEQMLYQRAIKGIRPVLYVSSFTDLECNMLMLLDENPEIQLVGQQQQVGKVAGYHVITN
jgi:hypothetical protein